MADHLTPAPGQDPAEVPAQGPRPEATPPPPEAAVPYQPEGAFPPPPPRVPPESMPPATQWPAPSSQVGEAPAKHSPGLGAVIGISLVTALIVGTFAGVLAGFAGARFAVGTGGPGGGTITVTGQTNEPVAAAAAAALPSVVNIDVSGGPQPGGQSGLPKGHPTVPLQGNGSGVAFRAAPNGGTYILTNNHVIEGASSIVVTPVSGGRRTGTLVGTDPDTDIAVVRVDGSIPLIKLGNSKAIVVGNMTVAIGSPFGLEHSVSSGVVSALHRTLPPSSADASSSSLVDVIQTDAAINPGNSGGALVDRQGRLIGVPSAIFSDTGSNQGIGFAIPVNTAVRVATELITTGKVSTPFLGIIGQTVTQSMAATRSVSASEGALVLQVVKGSAAEKAGIKPNDVVVQLDQTPIRSMEDLIAAVRDAGVGTVVQLKVLRDGKPTSVPMTVGVKPANLQ